MPTEHEQYLLNKIDALGLDMAQLVKEVYDAHDPRTGGAFYMTPLSTALAPSEPLRWASIAKTHMQQGLMALRRAVQPPEEF